MATHVCLSSEVNAEYRESDRKHTPCANALLMPLVDRYVSDLDAAAGRQPEVNLAIAEVETYVRATRHATEALRQLTAR